MRRLRSVALATLAMSTALIATPFSQSGAALIPDPGVKGCDILVTAPVGHSCMLPWPNDAFTVAAKTTTGRRINISATLDPANKSGVHVNPKAQNLNDGFSPGSVILV